VKVYRDGDTDLPTICGTGLEDYVGTAWGMGAHSAPYGGAPLVTSRHGAAAEGMGTLPDLVGFYRWHVPDPIVFDRDLRVTIQQIGAASFGPDERDARVAYEITNPVAGEGWLALGADTVFGICERVDDYSAAAFTYCLDPQPVPPVDVAAATADIGLLDHERR
jgi:hypothetical protein